LLFYVPKNDDNTCNLIKMIQFGVIENFETTLVKETTAEIQRFFVDREKLVFLTKSSYND
jgi:hypothetical protein